MKEDSAGGQDGRGEGGEGRWMGGCSFVVVVAAAVGDRQWRAPARNRNAQANERRAHSSSSQQPGGR
jgi:hypothetical protein